MEGKARRPTASSPEKPSREGFAAMPTPVGVRFPAVPATAGIFFIAPYIHIVLTFIACLPLRAGGDSLRTTSRADKDTLYRYGEVLVSADRYPLSPRSAGALSYDAAARSAWNFESPGAALASVRNLHLSGYGGGMALQTVSILGMGSEHSLVLWNSMPAGNMQTGVSDMNLFSAADVGEIRVVPGGASALYGSGAVGGVVNLIPRFPYSGTQMVEFGARVGSFLDSRFTGRVTLRPDTAVGVSLRWGRSRSRGDFTFEEAGSDVTRENSDFVSRSFSIAGGWVRPGGDRLGMMIAELTLDQGSPGPRLNTLPQSGARRNDRRYVGTVSWEAAPSTRWGITATGLFDSQYERFLDRDGPNPADNFYRTAWAGMSAQVRYQASTSLLFQVGTDLHRVSAAGNAIDGTRSRNAAALSSSLSYSVSAWDGVLGTITPSVRWEGNSAFNPHASPRLGVNIERPGDPVSLRLHATAGGGRRDPTMNELHYSGEGGRGNPEIRPESSISYDVGVGGRITALGEGIEWDVTRYVIRMNDRIQWVPTENPRIWEPENIGKTRSDGWEVGAGWRVLPGEIEIRFDYSIINSRKGHVTAYGSTEYTNQLIYVPLDKGSVGLLLGKQNISPGLRTIVLQIEAIHTGERYVLDDQSVSLPGHQTVNGSVTVELGLPGGTLVATYAVENLSNASYVVMPNYPMPGFNHNLSINYTIAI